MAEQGGGISLPGQPSRTPGLPGNVHLFTFDGFEGLNTKPTRPAIEDQQCFVLDNFMPLGKNNARTLYDVGTPIYTAVGGKTVSHFAFANISDTSYCLVFLSDGGIVAVNTSSLAATTVAPAGTITVPTNDIGLAQWGSQYILICAPQGNGYFMWDGTSFYKAGSIGPSVTLSNSGFSYRSQPTITAVGGTGTGATFAAVLQSSGSISMITVTNAGSGYSAADSVVLAFSGGGSNTTAIVYTSAVGGAVTNTSIINAGSGYGAQTKVTVSGGGGTGATATATASGGISAVTITNPGQGYTSPPTLIFSDVNNAVAQATVPIMPFGVSGTALETYTARVWIVNGAAPSTPPQKSLVTFSAPSAPADFGTPDGGGNFLSTDSFLRVGFHAAKQANGFLYLIGDSSVNYISGVVTQGSPTTTSFSNQNVDPQVGSPWPDTVQVFSRAIVFANTFGVHAMYGGAVQKVSGPLDGIYSSVTPTGSNPAYGSFVPSSAVAIIFGIHVYMLLLPIVDQLTGAQVNKLLMWDGQKWWTASQSVTLTKIASLEINSVLTAYGTDGTKIYPLFQTPSAAITKTIRSKLWTTPTYLMTKVAKEVHGIFQSNANDAVASTISVDTEGGSVTITQSNVFGANWTATGGLPVSWTATGGASVVWQTSGLAAILPQTVNDATGTMMGLTLQTSSLDYTLISLTIEAQQYRLRV